MERCRVCSSDKVVAFGRFTYFSLQRCESCGFVAKKYGPELAEQISKGTVYESGEWLQIRQSDEAVRRYSAMLFGLYKPFLKPGSLLEVGPGDGWNLRMARDAGWKVTGVESSRANCEYIKSAHGIEVICDRFENVRLEPKFDNVLLSHLIEHIEDPKPFIDTILNLVVPGGVVITATPNLCSRWSRLWGSRWSPYLVPDHISFFCPKHLEMLFGDRATTLFRGTYEGPANFSDSFIGAVFNGHFQDKMMRRLKDVHRNGSVPKRDGGIVRAVRNLSGRPFKGFSKTMKGTDMIVVSRRI